MNTFCFETLIAADQIQPEDQFPFEFAETYLKELNERINSGEANGKFLVASTEISEYGLYDIPDQDQNGFMNFKVTMRDGEYYKCSKELLIEESDYFKNYFGVEGNELSTELSINNIPYEIMLPILDYIHYGTLYIKPRNVYNLLIASNFLKISAVSDACISFYKNHQRRDYNKDTEDVIGYTETKSCSPYCINDFYHVSKILTEYSHHINETIKPFVESYFDILINPVYAKFYNEEFVKEFLFNPKVNGKIPNSSVYAAFFFEWIEVQNNLGYKVPQETIETFAKCIQWKDVLPWVRKAATSQRFKTIFTEQFSKLIESGDFQSVPIPHNIRKEFRFWNCEINIPDNIVTLDFMLPGHRDAISELFHVLMCFPNLQTLKPRERFCKAYSCDTGSDCPDMDFSYPDQWEEFFANLHKYYSTVLKTIDFKYTFFYEGWNYALQLAYKSSNSNVNFEFNEQ